MKQYIDLLRARGFRATPGRVALLKFLAEARRPLTVEQIAAGRKLNVATIYRALNDLAQSGLLLRGNGVGDAMQFSYAKGHHHHMICADCGFTRTCSVC